ncbi:DUF924 family protein [Neptunomonas antarctica]|uniref:Uncharacterized conserved protein, DUF924 family n=1 Tax=Neptunomonas antarctica TaxID=619304 RepID=A0A1N7M6Y0_9GAMM|nr:DUF924 family protein [Neptunomonas antarctica]SIS81840.1 Uncharacterized conserved protein, DUF924 family [Neptunomonas antarctica]
MRIEIDEILQFWFGSLKNGFPVTDRRHLWWQGGTEIDREIDKLFGCKVHAALRGDLTAWKQTPRGRLALVILLDQFTRHIFRGMTEAFSGDEMARSIVMESIEQGHDDALEFAERLFFYMPLEHSESLAAQDLCISHLENMLCEVSMKDRHIIDAAIDFATQHRDMIVGFGRFPHRNQVLGRESTEEELAFLNQSHNRWGQ